MSYDDFIEHFPNYDFLSENFNREIIQPISWNSGVTIIECDAKLYSIYFITSGIGKVYKQLNNSKEILYEIYEPGMIAGDVEFINKRRTICTLKSTTEMCGYILNTSKLSEELRSLLILELAKEVAGKLVSHSINASIKLGYSLDERFAFYLLYDQKEYPLKMGEIADILGVTYRHLSRVVKDFTQKGLITITDGKIVINDKIRLEEIAEIITEDAFY